MLTMSFTLNLSMLFLSLCCESLLLKDYDKSKPLSEISELSCVTPDAVLPSPFTSVSSLSTALAPSTGAVPLVTNGLGAACLVRGDVGGVLTVGEAGNGATGITGTLTSTASFLSLGKTFQSLVKSNETFIAIKTNLYDL